MPPFNIPIPLPFPSPPGRLTSLSALPGNPYGTGFYLLERNRPGLTTDAFGFAWQFVSTPAGIGSTFGQTVVRFEEYLAQVNEVKMDIGGTTYNGMTYDLDVDEGRIMFSEFPIERIAVWVAPATSINLHWILFL